MGHSTEPCVAQRAVRPLLRELRSSALDLPNGPRWGSGSEDRVPHRDIAALLEERSRFAGGVSGLGLAQRLRAEDWGLVYHLFRNSRTLGEVCDRATRFVRLMHDAEVRTHAEGDLVAVEYRLSGGSPLSLATAEYILCAAFVVWEQILGQRPGLVAVHFAARAPRTAAPHERFFGASVRFGMRCDALVLPRSALSMAVPEADVGLGSILEDHAGVLLARLPPVGRLSARVRALVGAHLTGGPPASSEVAQRVGISARTLRRRLAEESTSFGQILDDARRESFHAAIRDRQESVDEIAFEVGFSDASALNKAVRRWTGLGIAAYRRSGPELRALPAAGPGTSNKRESSSVRSV